MNSRNEIKCVQNNILNAVTSKKRSIKRKWMELNALTNAHHLILLPYQAQLTHVCQLVQERRELLSRIQQQNQEFQQRPYYNDNDKNDST